MKVLVQRKEPEGEVRDISYAAQVVSMPINQLASHLFRHKTYENANYLITLMPEDVSED